MINPLLDGAVNLTHDGMDEERRAKRLMLQTPQTLGTNLLALASQAA